MSNSAPYKYAKALAFRAVMPAKDASLLIAFGRDLFIESVGNSHSFYQTYGAHGQRFPLWIAACAAPDLRYAAFLEEDQQPIGFVVMGANGETGHVHHLYVAPGYRGQGFGGLLDDYARDTLKSAGCSRAGLNVTEQNDRAIRFYNAQGWHEIASPGSSLRHMEVSL